MAASEPGARPPVFLAGPGGLAGDVVRLAGKEERHAATVRRLKVGERLDVTDGAGLVAECVVTAVRAGHLDLAVRARWVQPRPAPAVAVAQAIPKGDRGQLAVELMTEAGVDVIVPWRAERCIARWQSERGDRALERWRVTSREAAKQARRAWLPEITPAVTTAGLLERVSHAALAVLLDPAAPVPLSEVPLPRPGSSTGPSPGSGPGELLVVVGPEGGVSPAEAAGLTAAGAVRAHLGPTVLRTSSAGVVAASVLLSRSGRWQQD